MAKSNFTNKDEIIKVITRTIKTNNKSCLNKNGVNKKSTLNKSIVNKDLVTNIIDLFFEEMKNVVINGGRINIPKFGHFKVSERSKRKGRNPQTGEIIQICASKAPKFKPSSDFKKIANLELEVNRVS